MRKALIATGALLTASVFALAAQSPALAQVKKSGFETPRTSDGQPDITGFWTNVTLTPMTRRSELGDRLVFTDEEVAEMEKAVQIEIAEGNQKTDPNAPAEYVNPSTVSRPEFQAAGGAVGGYNRGWLNPGDTVMRVNGEPRTSILTTPNGRPPSRKANAVSSPTPPRPSVATRPGGAYDSYETRSMGERCVIGFGRNGGPPMFSNGFYNNNYLIVQSPESVMIEIEMNHDARIVRLNSKHRTDGQRPYFGDSIGWWEGDTLVVETTNIPRSQQFYGSWENLKVTERFTRVAEDRLHYGFTVEDADIWDAPWGGEYEFSPLNDVIYEYACHEGNYALPGILSGARYQERKGEVAQ